MLEVENEQDLLYRWRMILGPVDSDPPEPNDSERKFDEFDQGEKPGEEDDDAEASPESVETTTTSDTTEVVVLDTESQRIDRALSLLYDHTENDVLRRSKLRLNNWLQDIRDLFPHEQTLFLQKEAIDKMGIGALLFEKEVYDSLIPDFELIRTILELKDQIPPDRTADIRELVRTYAQEVEEKILWNLQNSLSHQLEKGEPTTHPRKNEIDWPKTIKQNLRYYQSDLQSIILKRRYGHQKKRQGYPVLYLAVDSSGSMMESMVSSAIIASILAHIRTVETHLILFDHEVADLSDHLDDVVELLFHIQMGGGTNIQRALNYLHQQIRKPEETYVFLISDLYDNRGDEGVFDKITALQKEGVTVHCILALQDDPDQGAFRYNKKLATALTHADVPCYAASPDQFPDMLKEVLDRTDNVEKFRKA